MLPKFVNTLYIEWLHKFVPDLKINFCFKECNLLLSYIVPILLYNCFSAINKINSFIFEEWDWFSFKKVYEVVFDNFFGPKIFAVQTIFQRPEQMKIWRCNIWKIWWVAVFTVSIEGHVSL